MAKILITVCIIFVLLSLKLGGGAATVYLFKVNNKNTTKMC